MVKECTFLESAQWFKSKNSAGFDQCSPFGKNKVDTIYCGPAFRLQTFDILRIYAKNGDCQNL